MQLNLPPLYDPVVLRDRSTGAASLTRSTVTSAQSIEWEGSTYPLVDVEVSSEPHPFWTGQGRVLWTAGRVEQSRRRYGRD